MAFKRKALHQGCANDTSLNKNLRSAIELIFLFINESDIPYSYEVYSQVREHWPIYYKLF